MHVQNMTITTQNDQPTEKKPVVVVLIFVVFEKSNFYYDMITHTHIFWIFVAVWFLFILHTCVTLSFNCYVCILDNMSDYAVIVAKQALFCIAFYQFQY